MGKKGLIILALTTLIFIAGCGLSDDLDHTQRETELGSIKTIDGPKELPPSFDISISYDTMDLDGSGTLYYETSRFQNGEFVSVISSTIGEEGICTRASYLKNGDWFVGPKIFKEPCHTGKVKTYTSVEELQFDINSGKIIEYESALANNGNCKQKICYRLFD